MQIPISIIVTAYQAQNYIEECLDSIANQSWCYNNQFEILVGVDNCQPTLDKLLTIKHKYKHLKVFMMNSNMGTYVTTNTLLDLTNYNHIIRFDSDDVMANNMIETLVIHANNYDIVRFGYSDFSTNINEITQNEFRLPHGVFFLKKTIFTILGGYQNWRCAADTELFIRLGLDANGNYISQLTPLVRIKDLHTRLFYRRQHSNSLTKRPDTNHKSPLRAQYKALLGKHTSVWIEKNVNSYQEY